MPIVNPEGDAEGLPLRKQKFLPASTCLVGAWTKDLWPYGAGGGLKSKHKQGDRPVAPTCSQ